MIYNFISPGLSLKSKWEHFVIITPRGPTSKLQRFNQPESNE